MINDSPFAQTTINTSNIVAKDFVEKVFVNLIYDNIDFNKEIASKYTLPTESIHRNCPGNNATDRKY